MTPRYINVRYMVRQMQTYHAARDRGDTAAMLAAMQRVDALPQEEDGDREIPIPFVLTAACMATAKPYSAVDLAQLTTRRNVPVAVRRSRLA